MASPYDSSSPFVRAHRFHEFDPVAKGIIDVDTEVALEGLVSHRHSRSAQGRDENSEIIDEQSWMGLAGWPKIGFNAEMYLQRPLLEPAPAPYGEVRWLRCFGDAEQFGIEDASLGFTTGGHRQLHVVDPMNLHDFILPLDLGRWVRTARAQTS